VDKKDILGYLLTPWLAYRIYVLRRRYKYGPTWYQRNSDQYGSVFEPQCVLQGPFKGMLWTDHNASTLYPAKYLLGTFEIELAESINEMCQIDCDRVINIGTSLGYYTVGMALRIAKAEIIGYEIEYYKRYLCNRLAKQNKVERRITLKGLCTLDKLQKDIEPTKRPIIICDIEGGEEDLLQPNVIPSLKKAVILVELHDMYRPQVSQRIFERFEGSHNIKKIPSRPRTMQDLPPGLALPEM
jgi:hypothetical protein